MKAAGESTGQGIKLRQSYTGIYDNFNIYRITNDTRLDNRSGIGNGTTTILVTGHPADDDRHALYQKLCLKDLLIQPSSDHHFDIVCQFRLLAFLKRDYKKGARDMRNDAPVIDCIEVKELETFPLPSMDIDDLILCNRHGSIKTAGPLAYYASNLKRKISLEKFNFNAIHDFARHVFEAVVLRAWDKELGGDDEGKEVGIDTNFATLAGDITREYISTTEHFKAFKKYSLFLRDAMLYIDLSLAIKVGE
ncbi:hypothetical protein BCR41DRAFT_394376 [Lobosporangium transversale]|uniref:DUF6589 domain-containing protein n=1 Tax=Lobosporangium transversale TaxID=64571 RepID=A0A1Y2GXP3_9FUNG|nr:hypothetical protein BCR41DRAFT_394376 [Lobosporangium transversale]ORZ22803.1 hypothetical protein BCR41DRAFT_394376 [Lobosporangium transversale]|eukprot:XP_021883357.1 hypothetical protein BCR41DRAFT_394376 [Lobosporangium transversale]